MKLKFFAEFVCPICDNYMVNYMSDNTVACVNPDCRVYNKKYKMPEVECEEVN